MTIGSSPRTLQWLRLRTRLILGWERSYAIGMPVLCAIAAWAALSLFSIWDQVPGYIHVLGMLGTIIAVIILFHYGLHRAPARSTDAANRRIETDAGLPLGTLATMSDRPFSSSEDHPLWTVHQANMRAQIRSLPILGPRALIDTTDPFAIRFVALITLITGIVIAGESSLDRLSRGLVPRFDQNAKILAEVWIEPPAYTGLPPQFLVRSAILPNETLPAITAPANAQFRGQVSRRDGKSLKIQVRNATNAGTKLVPLDTADGTASFTQLITQNAAIEIKSNGRTAIWPIQIQQDRAPIVTWQSPPKIEGRTRTILSVEIDDDYGIEAASAVMSLSDPVRRAPDAPIPEPMIVQTPIRVPLHALKGPAGKREIEINLTEHPWAGLDVAISVEVTDGAGQTAETDTAIFTLPARTFYNSLAQAVLEQRQSIALAPKQWKRSARIFDALTFAPERFSPSHREYLLMRAGYHRVFMSQGTDTEKVVESLWPLAISLEDEGLTLARERLQAAQAALREALARGAPQSQIDQLIEELRAAMHDYVTALQASGDANAADRSNVDPLNSSDLDTILDEIAELRHAGDTEEARQRLAELEQLLENLQINQGSSNGNSSQGRPSETTEEEDGTESSQGLGNTSDLIQRQRQLSDETFGARRGDRSEQGLSADQRELADAAADLQAQAEQELNDSGNYSADTLDAFGAARDSMNDAADALSRGQLSAAQQFQENAIEALRDGGKAMTEAMQQIDDEKNGNADQEQSQASSGSLEGGPDNRDPLGRPLGRRGETGVEIPDLSNPERIRDLTEQLREKLADPSISDTQRQYLEDLLRRF